jgi:hypothetical protein
MQSVPSALKPSKIWYWLGALSIVAGLVGGGAIMVRAFMSLNKTVDNFGRVRVPGDESCKLVFSKPGTYTIYYEYKTDLPARGANCQPTGSTESIDAPQRHPLGLEVSLIDSAGAELATTLSTTNDQSISLHGHMGTALREVQIENPGDYQLKVGGIEPDSAPFVLSVGRGALTRVAPFMMLGLGIGGLGTVLGIVALIVTASRRRSGRRTRANQQAVAGAGLALPVFPGLPNSSIYPGSSSPGVPSLPPPPRPPALSTPTAPNPTFPGGGQGPAAPQLPWGPIGATPALVAQMPAMPAEPSGPSGPSAASVIEPGALPAPPLPLPPPATGTDEDRPPAPWAPPQP